MNYRVEYTLGTYTAYVHVTAGDEEEAKIRARALVRRQYRSIIPMAAESFKIAPAREYRRRAGV